MAPSQAGAEIFTAYLPVRPVPFLLLLGHVPDDYGGADGRIVSVADR
jgi:hypothetical protein